MSQGVLMILAAAWIGSQVLGGQALERLGIKKGAGPAKVYNIDPETGVPNQNPDLPLMRDPQGNPY